MTDPKPHGDTHAEHTDAHDSHGHGHGAPEFDIIPESSGADVILNGVAWLALIVLMVFGLIMVNTHLHESEAASNEAPQAAPVR